MNNGIFANFVGYRLAGSDTTAISLRACFYYLIKNPRTYKKLISEIDGAEKNGQLSEYVTYEECLQLPYLCVAISCGRYLSSDAKQSVQSSCDEGSHAITSWSRYPSGKICAFRGREYLWCEPSRRHEHLHDGAGPALR